MAIGFQKIVGVFLFVVLFGSGVCALVSSGVCVAESSGSEKGLGVLRDFFGLDLSKYDIVVEENRLSEPFLGNVVYDTVFFSLTSADSKIKIVFTFVNDNLQNMYVFETEGQPLLRSIVEGNDVVNAQIFCNDYEQYLSRSFFGNLKSTLDGVVANKNYTRSFEAAVLEVTVYDNKEVTNFMWCSTVGGNDTVPYTAVVALGFKNNVLVSFTDTWSFNDNVGNAFGLLENNTSTTTNFDVKILSDNQLFDDSTVLSVVDGVGYFVVVLFIVTVVGVGFVFVTGLFSQRLKVHCSFRRFFVKKRVFGTLLCLLMVSVVFLPLIGTVNALSDTGGVIWGSRSSGASNVLHGSYSWRKTNVEIGLQEYVNSFLMSNCFITANGYAGFSNLWANKSSILSQAQSLDTAYNHVAVFDWDHGVGGYPGVISSSFYSGVPPGELHYMFEDDWGTYVGLPSEYDVDWSHGVYDMDIYEAFSAGKIHFAFINTCLSANTELFGQGTSPSGYALGMPFAFTHRIIDYVSVDSNSSLMSNDGYNCPDAFPQCYIGFPFGAASLDQYISYNGNCQPWYQWVVFFCYMAFNFDVSVNEALDWACSMQWGCPSFGVSPLQGDGFTAIWPIWDDKNSAFDASRVQGVHSTLAVYGNGNIHLKNFQASHMVTCPHISSGPKSVDTDVLVDFSVYSVDSFGHKVCYVFDWGDGTPQTITDYMTAGVPVSVSHFWSTAGTYNVSVRAQCEDGTWSDWSKSHVVTVGNSYWSIMAAAVIGLILCSSILLIIVWQHRSNRTTKQ